jgi:hypothetical protein
MRIVKTVTALAVFLAGVPALLYFVYFEPGSSSLQERPGVAAVETRSNIHDQYPSVNDLRQNDGSGLQHSFCIDSAIKRTLRDPDSFKFISASLWTQDLPRYGPKAWICQAKYRSKNKLGEYGLTKEAGIIFDADGCRVLNPTLERQSDEMTANERKMMMYAIKTIHDPFNIAQ